MTDAKSLSGVLTCTNCGSPLPLSHGGHAACLYCGTQRRIPADYQARAEAQRSVEASREATESAWLRLIHGRAHTTQRIAFALTACLPPLVAGIALGLNPQLGSLPLLGQFALPAVAPGAMVFGYGATAGSLRQSFNEALGTQLHEGVHHCRQCGAPLHRPTGAVSTTCLYCGSDNLFAGCVGEASARARTALRTLAEALADLQTRQRLVLGLAGLLTTLLIALSLGLTLLATMGA